MKSVIIGALGLFLIGSLLGCGSDHSLAPVSGTVTVDGKPEGGIKLYFSPIAVENNNNAGPYSTGITDDNGGFVLEDRHGNRGAVVGKHRAVVSYADAGSGKALTTPKADEKRKRMLKMMRARNFKVSEESAEPVVVVVTIPSGGTETLKIEVNSRKIK